LSRARGSAKLAAVPPSDYEQFRQQVDEQLLADLQMVYEAYVAKIRAYETLALTRGALPTGLRPPLSLNALAGAEPARLLPAPAAAPPAVLVLPAGPAPATETGSPAPPATVPAAATVAPRRPAPPRRPKRGDAFELYEAVLAALEQLDDVFDRNDLLGVLPFQPPRSTLHRLLLEIVREGELELVQRGRGAARSLYRKRKPGSGPASG
jgi:hypothetical protein